MKLLVVDVKKRFIAGAVCPKCGKMDSLQVWQDEEEHQQHRECVECHFQDVLTQSIDAKSVDLKTRVSEGSHEKVILEEDEQPLKIFQHPTGNKNSHS